MARTIIRQATQAGKDSRIAKFTDAAARGECEVRKRTNPDDCPQCEGQYDMVYQVKDEPGFYCYCGEPE